VIHLLFGAGFEPASGLLLLMLAGLILTMIGFPLAPMLYAIDRAGVPLAARAVSTLCYVVLIFPLAHWLGLGGAGIAYVAATAVLILINAAPLIRSYRGRASIAWRDPDDV
jgi:O-antigen/teichoic acid export membrane protein